MSVASWFPSRIRLAVVVLTTGLGVVSTLAQSAPVAAATDIGLSPTSGPAGTVVAIQGSGCGPGLLGPTHVLVVAPTLLVTLDLTATASGRWSGHFVIPAAAAPISHAVTATCLSLVPRIYEVQTFTATIAAIVVPTTVPPITAPPVTTAPPTTVVAAPAPTGAIPPGGGSGGTGSGGSGGGTGSGGGAVSPPSRPPALNPSTAAPSGQTPVASSGVSEAIPFRSSAVSVAADPSPTGSRAGFRALDSGEDLHHRSWWSNLILRIILILLLLSLLAAALWFGWLRRTRARDWWTTWLHQVTRLRAESDRS